MKNLKRLLLTDDEFGRDSIYLEFDSSGVYVGDFDTPDKYDFEILYATVNDDSDEEPEKTPEKIWVMNYRALEDHINKPDILPDWSFRYVDEAEVLEKEISLRDFMKKYIFKGKLIEELYADD